MRSIAFRFLYLLYLFVAVNGQTRVPTLLWASQEVFGAYVGTTTSYETVRFTDLWNSVVNNLILTKREDSSSDPYVPKVEDKPDFFIIFISKQLTWSQMGQNTETIKPLKSAFDNSNAQLAFTNAILEKGKHLRSFVPGSLQDSASARFLGSCSENTNEDFQREFFQAIMQPVNAKPNVLVVCGSGTLKEEMSQLDHVSRIMNDGLGTYTVMFVSEPTTLPSYNISTKKRRTLLESAQELPTNYTFCNDLCLTQVKVLEAMVLALILAFALTAGLCCMNILDSPSQFEKPDED